MRGSAALVEKGLALVHLQLRDARKAADLSNGLVRELNAALETLTVETNQ